MGIPWSITSWRSAFVDFMLWLTLVSRRANSFAALSDLRLMVAVMACASLEVGPWVLEVRMSWAICSKLSFM